MIITRFSPSPTGYIHIGNVRIALLNILFSKKFNGKFIIRIEDTDLKRSNKIYIKNFLENFNWLFPTIKVKIFYQSKRKDIYEKFCLKLLKNRNAYYCFCTIEELEKINRYQKENGKPTRYNKKCRYLNKYEIKKKISSGLKPIVRFKINKKIKYIKFFDLVYGKKKIKLSNLDDFIIKRSDGSSVFLFTNTIDDVLMNVNNIIRGSDHLTNTVKQILIRKSLNFKIPNYIHIPLVIDKNFKPLSKRNNNLCINELKKKGYFPEVLLNYIFRLGYKLKKNKLYSIEELSKKFSISNISKSSSCFDKKNLIFWQKKRIREISSNKILEIIPYNIKNKIPYKKRILFIEIIKSNITFVNEIKSWIDICFKKIKVNINYEEYKSFISKNFIYKVKKFLYKKNDMNILNYFKNNLFILRIIITSKKNGPNLKELVKLIDYNIIYYRLNKFIKYNE